MLYVGHGSWKRDAEHIVNYQSSEDGMCDGFETTA